MFALISVLHTEQTFPQSYFHYPWSKGMAKTSITCPFSNKACIECAIYRGRHFYLCFAKANCESGFDMSQHSRIGLKKAHGNEGETFKRLTEFPVSPRMISDVEDLIEAEELLRLKEKGEKHDS